MDAIEMQDTKAMTTLFPCYENISGGQEWQRIWDKLLRPADAASTMRAAPLRPLYALKWLLLH